MALSALERQQALDGLASANLRRAEFAYMANGSRKTQYTPQPPEITQPSQAIDLVKRPQDKPTEYPETVTFYSSMGVHASCVHDLKSGLSKVGGAWRLYILAKALDRQGYGRILCSELRSFALHVGISPRNWQRWVGVALELGLLKGFIRKDGEKALYLPGPSIAAKAMGCDDIGSQKLEIDASLLVSKGWKSYVWAGVEAAGLEGKQISRKKLLAIHDVPIRTQRHRTAQAGTQCQANYANLGVKVKHNELEQWKKNTSHKGLFIAGNGYLYSRKPDTRSTDRVIYVGRGRSRKATAKLRALQGQQTSSLNMQRVQGNDFETEYIRLFCHTPKQLKTSKVKASRQDVRTVSELYQRWYEAPSGAFVWDTHVQSGEI